MSNIPRYINYESYYEEYGDGDTIEETRRFLLDRSDGVDYDEYQENTDDNEIVVIGGIYKLVEELTICKRFRKVD